MSNIPTRKKATLDTMNPNGAPTQIPRIVLAFCLSPLLPAFYGALLFAQPWALPIGLMVSYPTALFFAAPTFIWLRRSMARRWWAFAMWGAACAVPALIVYAVYDDVPHMASFNPANAAALLAWGAFSGICFWLIGIAGDSPLRWRDVLDLGPPSS